MNPMPNTGVAKVKPWPHPPVGSTSPHLNVKKVTPLRFARQEQNSLVLANMLLDNQTRLNNHERFNPGRV